MLCHALPEVAKEVSAPLANVDNITMYRDQTTKLLENNTQKIDQILKLGRIRFKESYWRFCKNKKNK